MVKNVFKKLGKKQKNNKGFSLVELIVVIAIMAVLVGVLAPQLIKYVEKSREATDIQNCDSIATALKTYYSDKEDATGNVVVTVTKDATPTMTVNGTNDTAMTALDKFKYEVANELGMTNYQQVDKGQLTSRENGYVGGYMVRKMIQFAEQNMSGQQQ